MICLFAFSLSAAEVVQTPPPSLPMTGESESANRLPKHKVPPSTRKARSGRLALFVREALVFCCEIA